MNWIVYLVIQSCTTKSPIPGAMITDGITTYTANGSGRVTVAVNGSYSSYTIQISAANYDSAPNVELTEQMNGTTQTFCLNPTSGPPPVNNHGW